MRPSDLYELASLHCIRSAIKGNLKYSNRQNWYPDRIYSDPNWLESDDIEYSIRNAHTLLPCQVNII